MTLDSVAADQAIMARCHAGYDYMRQFRTTMEMWQRRAWYRDVLFHHDVRRDDPLRRVDRHAGRPRQADTIAWLASAGPGQGAVNYRCATG